MNPLHEMTEGATVIIRKIEGDNRFLTRLTSIGLAVGSHVDVIRNEEKCPVLVYGRNTVVAINRSECNNIIVEEVKA